MIHAIVLSALLLLGPCFSAYAQEIKCPTASRDEMIGNDSSTCRCGTDLGNVTLTPPRGLKLKAACRLRIWQTDRFVEIPKSRPVNLDRYDSRGNSISRVDQRGLAALPRCRIALRSCATQRRPNLRVRTHGSFLGKAVARRFA